MKRCPILCITENYRLPALHPHHQTLVRTEAVRSLVPCKGSGFVGDGLVTAFKTHSVSPRHLSAVIKNLHLHENLCVTASNSFPVTSQVQKHFSC